MQVDLKQAMIMLTIGGSRAYGMNTSESDTDLVGVAIAPIGFYTGFLHNFEQKRNDPYCKTFLRDEDMNAEQKVESVVYDLLKFFKLCADCNPNIIEIVWTPDECIRFTTPLADQLRANRELFLSKKARYTFCGYAYAQLKRIETHRKWLLDPRQEKPERKDFGLPETQTPQYKQAEALIRATVSRWEFNDLQLDRTTVMELADKVAEKIASQFGGIKFSSVSYPLTDRESAKPFIELAKQLDDEEYIRAAAMRKIGLDDNLMELVQKEHAYHRALEDWKNYQHWKTTRNPDRAALEAKFGYDTKHAAHLVRLMRMAHEIMQGKGVHVRRPDAEELKAIRAGTWKYDDLMQWVKDIEQEVHQLYETENHLPKKPDVNKLNDLCVDLVHQFNKQN